MRIMRVVMLEAIGLGIGWMWPDSGIAAYVSGALLGLGLGLALLWG